MELKKQQSTVTNIIIVYLFSDWVISPTSVGFQSHRNIKTSYRSPPSLFVWVCDRQLMCSSGKRVILGGTDLCERRSFLREAESRWSASVMNPETWLEELQLSFCGKKRYKNSSVPLFLKGIICSIFQKTKQCINWLTQTQMAWWLDDRTSMSVVRWEVLGYSRQTEINPYQK